MERSVIVLSLTEMLNNMERLNDSYAVISITDSLSTHSKMQIELSDRCPNLCLFFLDVDDPEQEFSFSKAEALAIRSFVKLNRDRKFIVHCNAGVSRSAAVAMWIEEYLYGGLSPSKKHYSLHNKLVYRTLHSLEDE